MVRHLGILLAAAILTGCTHSIALTTNPALERPLGWRPLPVAVGIHYSPEFRAHVHNEWKYGDRWEFLLGRASVPLLDRAFAILFETPRTLDRRPPFPAAAPAVAGAIEPVIEEFTFGLPMVKTGTYRAAITYRFTLYSPSGDQLGAWTVQGEGAKTGQLGFEFLRWPGEAAALAMEDAAKKLVSGFRHVPAVSAWLRQIGVRDTGPPPTLEAQPATLGTSWPPAPATRPVSAAAPPAPAPTAPAVAAVQAPVGTWTGSVAPHVLTDRYAATLRILEEAGNLRWAIAVSGRDAAGRGLNAAGTVTQVDEKIVLTGRNEDTKAEIKYVLTRDRGALEGSGIPAGNRVYPVSLRRQQQWPPRGGRS